MIRPVASWAVHGVVPATSAVPSAAPQHEQVPDGGLALLISRMAPDDPRLARPDLSGEPPDQSQLAREAEAALQHNAILAAYAAAGDVVPARFGGAVSGREAALTLLREGADLYREVLARLAGAAEYAVRVRDAAPRAAAPAAPPAAGGRAYLARRRADRDGRYLDANRRRRALAEIDVALGPFSRMILPGECGPDLALSRAVLLSRDHVPSFVAACARLHAALGPLGLTLEVSGPWPAYSFARGEGQALLRGEEARR